MAGKPLVQELIQKQCCPEVMAKSLLQLFNPQIRQPLINAFYEMHQSLKCETNEVAATVITQMIEKEAGCLS